MSSGCTCETSATTTAQHCLIIRRLVMILVLFLLFPPVPHWFEIGQRRFSQGCQINVDKEKRGKTTGDQEMGTYQCFDPTDYENDFPQRRHVHQQEAGHNHQRQQNDHDHQVGGFLHRVELVFRGCVVRIGSSEEVIEE